ncbi:polyprenyl synthetase family protein [Streptomyces sp. NBC_01433]|uniref:polyprenyl synthetase family protein n=1 Tax=Streptomyces sp. NBC_01433 TaxID=2903864 RepID=UPI00224D233C|nr:polyprenyl synthetase family protein [Streptomyces sp. NBC_01433]MCX4681487.1 polyprenyl synthetase family protein [Streptomyces sp. NBC_01433]
MSHDDKEVTRQMGSRIAQHRDRFQDLFQKYFAQLHATADVPGLSRFAPECLRMVEELALRGGKRQRVAFAYEAANLMPGVATTAKAVDTAALSIELLQAHLLIHDDIIDNAATRRGGPSTYYAYRAKLPDHPQHALGLAVLAGDLALVLSQQVIADSGLDPWLTQSMATIQNTASLSTFIGQVFDLERDFLGVPEEELLHSVCDYKAARSSALAPLQLGLLAAEQDPKEHERTLQRYSTFFGVSGQMRDDYLSLFGKEEITGKPATADVADGRVTYLIRRALLAASETEKKLLSSVLGQADATETDVDTVREIVTDHCVDQSLLADMRRFAELASTEAAEWAAWGQPDAVSFFRDVPVWGVQRLL